MFRFIKLLTLTFTVFVYACTEQEDMIAPDPIEEPRMVNSGFSPSILFSYNVSNGTDNSESILIDNQGRVLRLKGELTQVAQDNSIPNAILSKWKDEAEPIEGIEIYIHELTNRFHELEKADKLVYKKDLEKDDSEYTTSMYGYFYFVPDRNPSSEFYCDHNNAPMDISRPIILEQATNSAIAQTNKKAEANRLWFKLIAKDLIDFTQFNDPN